MWGKLHSLCPVVSVSSLLRHNVFKVNSWFSIDQNCNLLRLNNISLCVPPRFVYPAVSGHLGYVHHLFTVMSNVPINIGAYSRFAHRSDFDMYIWKWTSWTVRLNVDCAFLWRLSVVWPWAGDCFFLCITGNKNSVRHPLLYGQGCYTTQVKNNPLSQSCSQVRVARKRLSCLASQRCLWPVQDPGYRSSFASPRWPLLPWADCVPGKLCSVLFSSSLFKEPCGGSFWKSKALLAEEITCSKRLALNLSLGVYASA